MKKRKTIGKLLALVLTLLITMTCAIPALTATDSAIEINSDYLFEQSTLDSLEFNFKELPDISVSGIGSTKYKLYDSNQRWNTTNDPVYVENRRIEFIDATDNYTKTLDFETHYPNLKITVTYSDCGTLNGKPIDAVFTYSDFYTSPETGEYRFDTKTLWWTAYGPVTNQVDANEWWFVGFSRINMDVRFRYHGESDFIPIENGYFTLYSMDGPRDENDYLYHSEAAASSEATNAYWYETRNMVYTATYTQHGYTARNVYFGNAKRTSSRGTANAMCFQFEDTDSVNLDLMILRGQWSEGYHVNFTPLTATVPNEPTKTASVSSATSGTQIEFDISQELPQAFDSNFTLQAFVMQDELDDYLEYKSAALYDESNIDITNAAGTLTYSGETDNEVTYTFDSDFLEAADYNGETVTLKITTELTDNIPVEALKNSASTTFNSTVTLTTNEVPISIYYPVTAKYVDKNGTPLSSDVLTNVNVGETYQTTAKEISNYSLASVSGEETGTITDHAVTVTYIYEPAATSVTAKYLNENNEEIAPSETIQGHVFDEYSTSAKTIYGYELTQTPANSTGTMTQAPITVNYIYTLKDAQVNVLYVDEEGNRLADPESITGKVFDDYKTSAKEIYGWRLTSTPANATGTMTEEDITVTYVYTQKQASVTANYVDEDGAQIDTSVITSGNVGETYTTSAKEIYGYELTENPSNMTGIYTENDIVVNYVYRLKDASVLVNYKNTDGESLADSIQITGKVFDKYNTENKSFYGYTLTAVPSNASGEMTETQITVDYIYELKDSSVLVNYVDEDYQTIAESETIPGKVFDEYTTSAKTIYGYELTATPSNFEGEMTEEQIVVNYVYRLKDSSVLVQYQDENGKSIAENLVIDGKVGQAYESEAKDIYGYQPTETPANANGTFAEEQIIVTYVYELKASSVLVNYLDESGQPLTNTVTLNGKVFDPYTTEAKEFYGYTLTAVPDNATGQYVENQIIVNYRYTLNNATVQVRYVDEKDNELTEGETISGKVFDKYTTTSKVIYGYDLIEEPDNKFGTMTDEPITVTYVYALKSANVTVKYVDTDNNPLSEDLVINGKVFDEYTTAPKTIYGYNLISQTDNTSGIMTEEPITVIYTYSLKPASVVANYIDTDGNALAESEIISGFVFDPYETQAKEFEGYSLTAVPSNTSGEMSEHQIVVNYIYSLDDSSVLVNYVDENGNTLQDSVTLYGKVFDPYTTEAAEIYGYTLTATPENAEGTMTTEQTIVDYVYTLKDAVVTVQYITENGEILAPEETITGKVFDPYQTEALEFYGYSLIAVPENQTGEMTEGPITVTYTYELNPAEVIVRFVDQDGNTLAEEQVISGLVFDAYETKAENINGYALSVTPDNAKGTMTEDPITVTYVYEAVPEPEIPYTGDSGIYGYISIAGAAVALIGVVLLVVRKKKSV